MGKLLSFPCPCRAGGATPVETAWLWYNKVSVEGQRAEPVAPFDIWVCVLSALLSHVCFVYLSPASVICSLSDITFRQEYQKKPCYEMSLSGLERIWVQVSAPI